MRIVRLLWGIALWLVQILLAVAFVLAGLVKFAEPSWQRNFARWGYPDGFYLVIGVLEAAGGLALLVPRLTSYSAVLLGAIMIGASLTHWVHGEMSRVAPPLMYVAFLIVAAAGRWRSALRLREVSRTPAQVQSM